jgi:hypothetical protein
MKIVKLSIMGDAGKETAQQGAGTADDANHGIDSTASARSARLPI